jgi:acyl-coenzyme A synthetase/AMP-(fatty) acid ligase
VCPTLVEERRRVNFVRDVVDAAPPHAPALIELTRAGERREWSFGDISAATARLAGQLESRGVGRGDVVLIWLGNRVEWVLSMLACFRIGAVAAACPEQLRTKDLQLRIQAVSPSLVIADKRNRDELQCDVPCPVCWVPDDALWRTGAPAAAADLDLSDPCLLTFTSGTSGAPKAVLHVQRYLPGQALQSRHWMGVEAGDIVWCTASSGWSKSARNVFIAPWLRGGTAVLHDGRFDPDERLAIIARERVTTLCMAPTEYRIIAKRSRIPRFADLEHCIAAGEALEPAVISSWRDATGNDVRDGYGQTETGQLTGYGPGEPVRPGSMGRPLPGVRLWIDDGELVADPQSVPTFFAGYLGDAPAARDLPWRTGDRVAADDDGFLWFNGRADDIIISAGYRIGPVEVESALASHAAVEEAAAVAAPDEERGSVVRALVVLSNGYVPSDQLKRTLQDHVKAQTAPYKYPRQLEFVDRLPKTPSGKIKRGELRPT